jgi:tagatose-1,6-bisphosphate aldolase
MVLCDKFFNKGKILMLALDHRGSFQKLLNPSQPGKVSAAETIEAKRQIIEAVYQQFSGILVDSLAGLPAYKQATVKANHPKPYLLCIEKTGYEDEQGSRKTQLEFSVEQLKNLGAGGIKLLLYYHPQAPTREHQLKIAKQVLHDCKAAKLPLFLELVTYPIENTNSHKPELVLDSISQFLEAKIIPDVFKLEFPGDPAACFQITKLLKKTPWILLTRGDSYQNFKEQLKTALNNGCQGFLAGRALWQEFTQYEKSKRQDFFQTVVARRFSQIRQLALST